MDASTLHPECTLGRQTPVCRQLGHEAAFRADQGLRTRHGHRRLGNVVLSASLSGGRQWPTTVCCGHLSQMDTPLVQNMATRGIDRAWAVGITDPRRKATYQDLLFARVEVSHCNLPLVYEQEDSPTVLKGQKMRGPLWPSSFFRLLRLDQEAGLAPRGGEFIQQAPWARRLDNDGVAVRAPRASHKHEPVLTQHDGWPPEDRNLLQHCSHLAGLCTHKETDKIASRSPKRP